MRKDISFLGKKVHLEEDKAGKVLYAAYEEEYDPNVTYHCGRALINPEGDGKSTRLNGYRETPIARVLNEDCGIDIGIGNKMIISRTEKDKNKEGHVTAIVFEDVSKLEAAIRIMSQNNKDGYSSFLNPNPTFREKEKLALEPVCLVSYTVVEEKSKKEVKSVNVLSAKEVDWDNVNIGCKNFLLNFIDENDSYVQGQCSVFSSPDYMGVIGAHELKEEFEKPINPNELRSQETAQAYKLISENIGLKEARGR